jgi:LysR family nitrogen assimilation transcriptional regulator
MNQRDLEYFVKVVEAGSFSHASILLGIPQPAVSRHVKELETELKINLLYRNGRGVVLTEAGERLYTRATAILEQMAEARLEALSLAGGGIESATIGMPPSLARLLTVPLTSVLQAAYPRSRLKIIDAFNGHLLEWLTASRLDAAIVYVTDATQRLNADPLFRERLSLVTAPGARPSPAETPADALAGLPLVLPSRPHGLRHQLEVWAAKGGIELNIRAECDSFCSLLQLVRDGRYATVFSAAALGEEIERDEIVASLIVEPQVERSFVLATPANRPVTCGVSEFSRMVKQAVRSVGNPLGWIPPTQPPLTRS